MGAPRRLLLDLDDCALGRMWPWEGRPWQPTDRLVVAETLALLGKHDVIVHALTNRPGAQLACWGQVFGGRAGWHWGESGLSAWVPSENRLLVNPRWIGFHEALRPEIMARLEKRWRLSWRGPVAEESGNKVVSVCLYPVLLSGRTHRLTVEQLRDEVTELLADLPVDIRIGGGVDVFPHGATKQTALEWAAELNAAYMPDDPWEWPHCLYIDDSVSGRGAMLDLTERGGLIATIGNSDPDLKALVEDVDGLVSAEPYERGVLDIVRQWLSQ